MSDDHHDDATRRVSDDNHDHATRSGECRECEVWVWMVVHSLLVVSYCFAMLRAAQARRSHLDVVKQPSLTAECDVPNVLANRHAALLQRPKNVSVLVRPQQLCHMTTRRGRRISSPLDHLPLTWLTSGSSLTKAVNMFVQGAMLLRISVSSATLESCTSNANSMPVMCLGVMKPCYSDLPDSLARLRFCRVVLQICS